MAGVCDRTSKRVAGSGHAQRWQTVPVPNKGDTSWMLMSSALVLLMTVPGLALFYGGLVRTKNMLSILMQVFYTVCIVSVIWVLYGYSVTFTDGDELQLIIGGFSKVLPEGRHAGFDGRDLHAQGRSFLNTSTSRSR